jgi:hypothetical protein
LRDLGLAVDNVRKSVWATLSAEYADDYPSFLAKIRVRRANEICQDVLSDLYAETFAPNTSGLEVFRATLSVRPLRGDLRPQHLWARGVSSHAERTLEGRQG